MGRTMTRNSATARHRPFNTFKRNEADDNTDAHRVVKQPDLKLITLTPEQESTKTLKFVYDLPQNVKELKTLLADHSETDQLIIL